MKLWRENTHTYEIRENHPLRMRPPPFGSNLLIMGRTVCSYFRIFFFFPSFVVDFVSKEKVRAFLISRPNDRVEETADAPLPQTFLQHVIRVHGRREFSRKKICPRIDVSHFLSFFLSFFFSFFFFFLATDLSYLDFILLDSWSLTDF